VPGLSSDALFLTGLLEDVVSSNEAEDVMLGFKKLHELGMKRASGDNASLKTMINLIAHMNTSTLRSITRILTHALNLLNVAEIYHRFRIMLSQELHADRTNTAITSEDNIVTTLSKIKEENPSATNEDIYRQLMEQKIELVLTAHPTEVNRLTILKKYSKIATAIETLDSSNLTIINKTNIVSLIKRYIASIWGTAELRSIKPTPQDEAKSGISVIQSVLWNAVPRYARSLDTIIQSNLGGLKLSLDYSPVTFSSWIGGDRDGNPLVTPSVTEEVILTLKKEGASLYINDLRTLYDDLAISKSFSPKVIQLADGIKDSKDSIELYRRIIGHLILRLQATVGYCDNALDAIHNGRGYKKLSNDDHDGVAIKPLMKVSELKKPLLTIHDSLCDTGFDTVADGALTDTLRRISSFGLTLTPLDIREESDKHTAAIDEVTRHLGIGSYGEWDEKTKLNWLCNEINNKRPLFKIRDMASLGFSEGVLTTLNTFKTISDVGEGALGAYVISQARTASDVMAVMLLQKQFGMTRDNKKMMRVVPLFETLDDLNNAPAVAETLFSLPAYMALCDRKQEIMVGYSDSAKDAGRLAACWAQYESQERMAKVAKKYDVELTFFHGKGGTVGRGGNPSVYRAVLAHPPNTINGRFRVTEQGEMITQNFGSMAMAMRTLDIYTSAVLREAFVENVEPTPAWRERMLEVSQVSCDAYRHMVRDEPDFVSYFRQATPELELTLLNIGSRPAKRKEGGIETLRAIPWSFAWSQIRSNLSAWLGVEKGLAQGDPSKDSELRDMYSQWPWFRETIDLISMLLSKSDLSICENYDAQLVKPELQGLGKKLRERLVECRENVLTVTGCKDTTAGFELLAQSMKVRSPFVDPLNVIQAELLKRYRNVCALESKKQKVDQEEKRLIIDALQICITGIAQGMRNSG
jgi:phosphoenolpyruvate carboxylase